MYPGGLQPSVKRRNNICCVLEGNPLWHVDYVLETRAVCRAALDKRRLELPLLEGVLLRTFQKGKKK